VSNDRFSRSCSPISPNAALTTPAAPSRPEIDARISNAHAGVHPGAWDGYAHAQPAPAIASASDHTPEMSFGLCTNWSCKNARENDRAKVVHQYRTRLLYAFMAGAVTPLLLRWLELEVAHLAIYGTSLWSP
jgi:hypothetical protein